MIGCFEALVAGLRRRYRAVRTSRATAAFFANPLNVVGLVIVATLTIAAVFGPVVAPTDPSSQELANRLQPPTLAHPMGTDQLGRDVFSRLLYGARLSLGIAVAVTAIRLVLGTAIGLLAGYAGGLIDELLMRLVDVQLAFPGLVLALVVAGILGPSLRNVMLALAVVGWASYARLVRSSVLSTKEREFVQAARLMGVSRHRIAIRHLLPNTIGPIIVLATMNLGTVILGTAGLSFIGLGAQPPTPEWGTMLSTGRHHLRGAWWLANAPGAAIMLTVLGFNLLGDGLRDVLDPNHDTPLEKPT
ncbi:binding-protein-dependent transport systems inner membrane component [Natrinema pellirubrum DSM 15624]|uniref:ABC-type dipeptide/oligopeptide/nickel transport system, permease component n=1 Tax=Natrinema pellirubrum (strain DSM 15624 / CIP 106293 / JCM 10476 / NCIMB 786 / 157) TaxID=797303 RepID=L0JIA8_NATP1|nr:nickel transporter permease [Natrinema pellirubrum]AGB31260.1 ABC-type dipeptide/oligopeptide/nickel transport system, permease component [Natrinema pellirubrum DSM 15624]ELY81803.1 binding-protein-dependent transport systems inner membrane component [Natrinema pellirubrum DSM 15624]